MERDLCDRDGRLGKQQLASAQQGEDKTAGLPSRFALL